jgi:hypothetical protein
MTVWRRISFREIAWSAVFFLGLAVLHLAPGSFHIFHRYLGPNIMEGPEYGWRMWWYPYALFVKHQNPFFCDIVFWPQGMDLSLQSTCFLKEFLGGLAGGYWYPLAVGNIITLFTVAANGVVGYYIGRRLFRLRVLAYLTGIFLCIGGSLNQNITHLNILSMEGFMLYIFWSQEWMRDPRPGKKHLWRLGLSSALSVACFIQNIVFLSLWTLLLLMAMAFLKRLTALHIKTLLYAVLVCIVLNLPQLVPNMITFAAHPEWAKGYSYENDIRVFRFSLIDFFLPWKQSHPLYSVLSQPFIQKFDLYPQQEPFMGFLVLGLTLYGLFRYTRKVLWWFVPGVIFFLWSMGYDIRIIPKGKALFPGPFRLVMILPIVNTLRNPSRLILVTQLCFGISAGYGVMGLVAFLRRKILFRIPGPRVLFYLAILFASIHLWELTLFPYPSSDPRHCPYYSVMRNDPEDVAVLDCPMQTGLQCHMYFTSLHHKRAIHGFGGRMWLPIVWEHEDPFYIEKMLSRIPPNQWPGYARRLSRAMFQARVKYITIHKWLYPNPGNYQWVIQFLENRTFWENQREYQKSLRVYEDETHLIYRLVPYKTWPERVK